MDSSDTKVNEDDIIISHQFFTILMSLNNINDMKPFLNSKHIRFLRSPPSNTSSIILPSFSYYSSTEYSKYFNFFYNSAIYYEYTIYYARGFCS